MSERERLKQKEPEAVQRLLYDRMYGEINAGLERQFTGRIVIKGSTAPSESNRQGLVRRYLYSNYFTDTVLQDWLIILRDIRIHSGCHIHQGGLCIYALEGSGYTIADGVRYDWKAGDLLLLPVKPGGVEHQHFNDDPSKPCLWMAFINIPYWRMVANGMKQVSNADAQSQSFGDELPTWSAGYDPNRDFKGWPDDSFGRLPESAEFNGYAAIIRRRDAQRAWLDKATLVVRGDSLPWEVNPQGIMQWYLHPDLEDPCIKSLLFYRQQILPGSRSGRQIHQGNMMFYVQEGEGFTTMDGQRYNWEAGDLVQLPLRPNGVTYQHFNTNKAKRALLLACEPNSLEPLGVDKGSGFVQMENCPEYSPGKSE